MTIGELWFLTGSQHLYGDQTLRQVAEQSQRDRRDCSMPRRRSRRTSLWKAGAHRRRRDPPGVLGGQLRRRVHRRDRVDAHLLPGQDVDRRPGRARQAVAAPAHAGEPCAPVVAHRHGLHEPQPGGARRPRVRLPRDPAGAAPQDGGRPRDRSAASHRRIGHWARARAGWRQRNGLRLARFGDNMRGVAVTEGDKVEAQLGLASRWTPTASTTWSTPSIRRTSPMSMSSPLSTRRITGRAAAAPRTAHGTTRCATPRQSRSGLRRLLTAGGSAAFTTNFEDLAGLRQLPGIAVQRLMADGYGFGAEGDWKTSILLRIRQGHGHGPARRNVVHGGLLVPLRAGHAEDPWRAHARGLPVHS